MWCHRCRQDVPAVAFGATKGVGCIRCGAKLTAEGTAVAAADTSPPLEASGMGLGDMPNAHHDAAERLAPHLDFDDWDNEPEWRLLDELTTLSDHATKRGLAASGPIPPPIPPPISGSGWNVMHAAHGAAHSAAQPIASVHFDHSDWLSSLAIGVGAIGLAAAAASFPLSRITGWDWLANWCWPAAAAGQVLWVIGFALQLDRIRQSNRTSGDELQHVKSQLIRLEQTTALLRGPHGPAGQAYYQPLAANENSNMLLADVKGQLDQLSRRLAQVGR